MPPLTQRRNPALAMCHPLARGMVRLVVFTLCLLVATSRTLAADALQSMVIISGDQGRGSGFIVKLGGRAYLVTNAHVVRGNPNLKFKTLNNRELKIGPLEIADEADLVRAEIIGNAPALEIAPQVDQSVKIGDDLIVAGAVFQRVLKAEPTNPAAHEHLGLVQYQDPATRGEALDHLRAAYQAAPKMLAQRSEIEKILLQNGMLTPSPTNQPAPATKVRP